MTNDLRHPDEIERDILDERARLSDTIDELQKKFSVDAIVGDIGSMFRTQGGDLGRAVSETVGRNPAAVVLVGVGLAWLFIGQGRKDAATAKDPSWRASSNEGRSWPTQAERRNANSVSGRFRDGPSSDQDAYWYGSGDSEATRGRHYRQRGDGDGAMTATGQIATSRTYPANGIVGTMQETAGAVGAALSGAAGSMGHAATDLTDRLSHGLEDLSDEARSRVLAARQAAHDARRRAADALKTGARASTNFFEDQPLVVGALAVALGAALGGVLPHSRLEDDTLGASSDRLFADAQALYREERAKAMAAVKTAAADVRDEIKDVGSDLAGLLPEDKSVADVIVDRASDAARRVVGHATGEGGQHDPERSPERSDV